jgi:hypothetical protein
MARLAELMCVQGNHGSGGGSAHAASWPQALLRGLGGAVCSSIGGGGDAVDGSIRTVSVAFLATW